MADAKITALTALTTATTDDIFPVVDDPSGTPVTKKITLANLLASLGTLGKFPFPATQVASAGANDLDDYEEGTFTVGIAFGGGTTGLTYTSRAAVYRKVGQLVFIAFTFTINSKGSSGGVATITGLPFTSANSTQGGGTAIYYTGMTVASLPIYSVDGNATTMSLWLSAANAATALGDANFNNGSAFYGATCYIASA